MANEAVNEKQLAGEKACEFIRDGMTIGLGTGRTVYYTIKKLAALIKAGLRIRAVPTSNETTELCRSLHIPLVDLAAIDEIELTIDGADYIDPAFNGIKGGHGALLTEKIVAGNSRLNIWVVEKSKLVGDFCNAILPLEICPVGYKQLYQKLIKQGYNARLRVIDKRLFQTDLKNYIIDLILPRPADPGSLNRELKQLTGVFETGLFINIVDTLIVGRDNGAEIINIPLRGTTGPL